MSSTSMADERRLRRCIKKVEFEDFRNFNMPLFSLTIRAGGNVRRSPIFKVQPKSIQPWPVDLDISDLELPADIEFKLYGRKARWSPKKLLGQRESTVSDILSSDRSSEVTVSLLSCTSPESEICTLKLFLPDDLRQTGHDAVKDDTKPETPLEKNVKLLDALLSIKIMIDVLSEVHPSARIAWGFLKIGIDILKKQGETDDIVVNLYKNMLSAYDQAGRKEVLQKRNELQSVYDALFKQTIECSYLIRGYANIRVTGRVSSPSLSRTAKEFQDGFAGLCKQLHSGVPMDTHVVTLGVQQQFDKQSMQDLLHDLRPSIELSPKSTCVKGTRVETINYLMAWIAECSGGLLWCSGLTGTGKSSLVGTLHEYFTVHAGSRNRLGAFIRYDRSKYHDSAQLITSIAYSLGMSDNRIGTAISEVFVKNRAVLSMAASSASDQVRLLLQEPLESLQDLADEGPLVVIIDGMDESDASTEMLNVLSRGFGPKLPFMRLLVFSQPIEAISRVFAAPNSAVTRFALDTASWEVNTDIRHYIQTKFDAIHNDPLTPDDNFTKACKELNAVDELSMRASGLFIWAVTACSFIGAWPSVSRLLALLSTPLSRNATDALTTFYRTILDDIVSEIPGADEESIRAVLGALMAEGMSEGMTADALDTLVTRPGDPPVRRILASLDSVIHETSIGYYRFAHKSFYDFLQDQSRSGTKWYIDVERYKARLVKRRLEVLQTMFESGAD